MNIDNIKNILIIGAGTMGHQIAFQCAAHGYDVIIYDNYPQALKKSKERIKSLGKELVKKNIVNTETAHKALDRITFEDDPEKAGKNADIISESIPEDPKLKGEIFARFNSICPNHTIFTTNTSSLIPSMYADATGRPERFLAFHFHDIALTSIVDIMPHAGTSPEITKIVIDFAKKIKQIPIVLKKEHSGYLFNNMLMAYLDSALSLASSSVASIEDIDRAWMGIMHTETGPFGLIDSVGLDTCWKITSFWAEKRRDTRALKNADFIKSYIDAGKLGKKSGQGFYNYPNPAFALPDFLKELSDK